MSLIIVLVGAVIFNPILPFHFPKALWLDIDRWTILVIVLVFITHESSNDVDPDMRRFKSLQLQRSKNLKKIDEKRRAVDFTRLFRAEQKLKEKNMTSLMSDLDALKVSETDMYRSSSRNYHRGVEDIIPFLQQTTNYLDCKYGDILLLVKNCSYLFDKEKQFGIEDVWLIERPIDLTLTNIVQDVPDFIALTPEEVKENSKLDPHVETFFKVGEIDQHEFAWKIHERSSLVWLRPSNSGNGILRVFRFKSNAILAKNEIDFKVVPSFDSINNLSPELKRSLWDLFKYLKASDSGEKHFDRWAI